MKSKKYIVAEAGWDYDGAPMMVRNSNGDIIYSEE